MVVSIPLVLPVVSVHVSRVSSLAVSILGVTIPIGFASLSNGKSDLREVSRKVWEEFKESRNSFYGDKLAFIPPIIKEGKKLRVIGPKDVVHEASDWNETVICAVLCSKPPH